MTNTVHFSRFCPSGFHLAALDVEGLLVLSRLLLVGVEHGDPDGYRRTIAFLEDHRPDLILIELSPFGLHLRKKRSHLFLQTLRDHLLQASNHLNLTWQDAWHHPDIVRIRKQICLPFEYRAARRYARDHDDSGLVMCDASEFSRRWIASWPDLISQSNLEKLLSLSRGSESHVDGYAMARKAMAEETSHERLWTLAIESRWGSWWEQREQFLARKILTALHAFAPQRAVYLGGWQHLLQGRDRTTLRDLMNIPAQRCRLLPDVQPVRSRLSERGRTPTAQTR